MLVDIKEELKKLETVAKKKFSDVENFTLTESEHVEQDLTWLAKKAGFTHVFEDISDEAKRVYDVKIIQEMRHFIEKL